MIKINLQFFGGRGASSGAGGKTFKNVSDFENALTGINDPRLAEYRNAYSEESAYNKGLKNNLNQSIVEDGYTDFTDAVINGEIKSTKNELKAMPTNKTPEQLGREKGLNERMDVLNDLKARKGEKAKGRKDEDIVLQKTQTKFSTKELNSMSRRKLEEAARATFIKKNSSLPAAEADRRARALMSGNSDAQLRKYIKKYG